MTMPSPQPLEMVPVEEPDATYPGARCLSSSESSAAYFDNCESNTTSMIIKQQTTSKAQEQFPILLQVSAEDNQNCFEKNRDNQNQEDRLLMPPPKNITKHDDFVKAVHSGFIQLSIPQHQNYCYNFGLNKNHCNDNNKLRNSTDTFSNSNNGNILSLSHQQHNQGEQSLGFLSPPPASIKRVVTPVQESPTNDSNCNQNYCPLRPPVTLQRSSQNWKMQQEHENKGNNELLEPIQAQQHCYPSVVNIVANDYYPRSFDKVTKNAPLEVQEQQEISHINSVIHSPIRLSSKQNMNNEICSKLQQRQNQEQSIDEKNKSRNVDEYTRSKSDESTTFPSVNKVEEKELPYGYQRCCCCCRCICHSKNQQKRQGQQAIRHDDQYRALPIPEETDNQKAEEENNGENNDMEHLTCPKTRFGDIIGHGAVKLRMEEVLLPIALPPSLASTILTGVRSLPASILLYGPPGCGKTQLARAIAGEAGAAFLSIGPSDVLSKYVGESEASIRGMFQKAHDQAKQMESRCAILFFDEIDALGQSRVSGGDLSNGSGMATGASSGGGGADNCSRRILAELLIQLNRSSSQSSRKEPLPQKHGRRNRSRLDYASNKANARDGNENKKRKSPPSPSSHDCREVSSFGDSETSSSENDDESKNSSGTETENAGGAIVSSSSVSSSAGTLMLEEEDTDDEGEEDSVRVIIVAATNRPCDCDPALLRRFGIRVHVGFPSKRHRRKILYRLLNQVKHSISKYQLDDLASLTEGWSGSDLESLAREAAMAPLRECIRGAALSKRRARLQKRRRKKREETSAAEEGPENLKEAQSKGKDPDPNLEARESLLSGLKSLRPVTLNDFDRAMQFWLGNQQTGRNVGVASVGDFGGAVDCTGSDIGDDVVVQSYDSSSCSSSDDSESDDD